MVPPFLTAGARKLPDCPKIALASMACSGLSFLRSKDITFFPRVVKSRLTPSNNFRASFSPYLTLLELSSDAMDMELAARNSRALALVFHPDRKYNQSILAIWNPCQLR